MIAHTRGFASMATREYVDVVRYPDGLWGVNGKTFDTRRAAITYAEGIADALNTHHDRNVVVRVERVR